MAKTTIGHAHCPECQSIQAVQSDGLKHFIHCNACNTFTHYQRKEAKKRIEGKLLPELTDDLELVTSKPETGNTPDALSVNEPEITPEKPERRSFFDVIAQYL